MLCQTRVHSSNKQMNRLELRKKSSGGGRVKDVLSGIRQTGVLTNNMNVHRKESYYFVSSPSFLLRRFFLRIYESESTRELRESSLRSTQEPNLVRTPVSLHCSMSEEEEG